MRHFFFFNFVLSSSETNCWYLIAFFCVSVWYHKQMQSIKLCKLTIFGIWLNILFSLVRGDRFKIWGDELHNISVCVNILIYFFIFIFLMSMLGFSSFDVCIRANKPELEFGAGRRQRHHSKDRAKQGC